MNFPKQKRYPIEKTVVLLLTLGIGILLGRLTSPQSNIVTVSSNSIELPNVSSYNGISNISIYDYMMLEDDLTAGAGSEFSYINIISESGNSVVALTPFEDVVNQSNTSNEENKIDESPMTPTPVPTINEKESEEEVASAGDNLDDYIENSDDTAENDKMYKSIPTIAPTATPIPTVAPTVAPTEAPAIVISDGGVINKNFTIDSPVLSSSGLSVDDIEVILAGTDLAGHGQCIYNTEHTYGVNAFFILGVAGTESAFGKSNRAKKVHDCFGQMACKFETLDDGIDYFGKNMSKYNARGITMTPKGIDPTYSGIPGHTEWAKYVVVMMNQCANKL